MHGMVWQVRQGAVWRGKARLGAVWRGKARSGLVRQARLVMAVCGLFWSGVVWHGRHGKARLVEAGTGEVRLGTAG